ncbi:polyhydroxyalkonate synthesis repressor, PhaR [Magnetococcus marinus MC-1]|uniref:Polyhydroxyalkonate synthesis repressor, PhaR n=1 Tax=Magnetococcus marinus (strain ATCC BAA-1437 / JCM 17883 / MC-1) TaxID=156889 RepID=A0L6T5_MAGMM|nr:polyhydroxyalkanoate synthesis repressor PhaR [Magnetococcus marinus]ABK43678.1 polyhydroxyalkonate synthesis repressor, PhaR [Magnetococcus marinus MC-1]
MDQPRIIKKYPNRRLYDTETSEFVTLEGIHKLVVEGIEFKVIDSKSGADVTRTILLQVIADEEEKGDPVFSTDFLTMIIRLYGGAMQSFTGDFLKQSITFYLDNQKSFLDQIAGGKPQSKQDPYGFMAMFNKAAEQNMQFWNQWQSTLSGGKKKEDK